MPGGDDYYEDDIDSDVLESLLIVGLTAALGFLLYYRNQRQRAQEEERRRQEQQQGQGQVQIPAGLQQAAPPQEDRGLFPQPGDPDFLNWAVGGVGH